LRDLIKRRLAPDSLQIELGVGKLGPSPISPSRELGQLPVLVYIKGGLIEMVSRTTSAIGPEPTVPVPDGASADSATVLAARESEHQPPRPTRRKRLRRVGRGSLVIDRFHLMILKVRLEGG
jgi:hypothetical protein